MKPLVRLAAVLTIATATGCLPVTMSSRAPVSPVLDVTLIEVTNNNFEDLIVYWRKGEVDIALGMVTGLTTRRFGISPAMLGDGLGVRLAIGPRGKPAAQVSSVFDAAPRTTVSWVVDYKLATSTVIVR